MEHQSFELRWVDSDSYGHINNAKYFDLMTEMRARSLMHLSIPPNLQFVLADTQCSFKRPLTYPDSVEITQSVSRIGRSSFTLNYQFFTQQQSQLHATGTARMVCFDTSTMQPCNIPDTVIPHLQQHLATED